MGAVIGHTGVSSKKIGHRWKDRRVENWMGKWRGRWGSVGGRWGSGGVVVDFEVVVTLEVVVDVEDHG